MNYLKLNDVGPYLVLYLLSVFVSVCFCYPPFGYKEDSRVQKEPKEIETTPKKYVDRFPLQKEVMKDNGSTNGKNSPGSGQKGKAPAGKHFSLEKVKAVNLGDKTLRQSNGDDDDDDDDGGEYDGLLNGMVKTDTGSECNNKQKKDSVPMMIIREVDMVAMEIPVSKDKDKEQKDWSSWSQCSKLCGDGVQSRWRVKTPEGSPEGGTGAGVQEREQQLRPCHLADCPVGPGPGPGSQYDYGPASGHGQWRYEPPSYH